MFQVADQLSTNLVKKWNDTIQAAYDSLKSDFGSRFTLDPKNLDQSGFGTHKVVCRSSRTKLGEQSSAAIVRLSVREGTSCTTSTANIALPRRLMPQVGCDQKRIQVTTELREYWICR